jgi:Flagellar hook-length control protein FliK
LPGKLCRASSSQQKRCSFCTYILLNNKDLSLLVYLRNKIGNGSLLASLSLGVKYSMQPISNASLAPGNGGPSASNAGGRLTRSSATDEQQQFSPILRAAIEGPTSKSPQIHSQRTDNNSAPEATSKNERQISGDKKPVFLAVPVDPSTLLTAHALPTQPLEIKSATSLTNFASVANPGESVNLRLTQEKTFVTQLQNANDPPNAMSSGTAAAIGTTSLQSNETHSLSSRMVVEQPVATNQIGSAAAATSRLSNANTNTAMQANGLQTAPKVKPDTEITSERFQAQQSELRATSTQSDLNLLPDSNPQLQKDLAGVPQANSSVGPGVSPIDTSALASSAPQIGANLFVDMSSRKTSIAAKPDLSGALTIKPDLLLKLDKLDQQNRDGSFVSGAALPPKSDASQSPSPATSPATQSDPRFASLLSSVTQHLTISLAASDQKRSVTVQKESNTPVSASSASARGSGPSQSQDFSSGHENQNSGSDSAATSAAIDGTNLLSINVHNTVAPKIDLGTQTIANGPDSLVSASNRPANPPASLPETAGRPLETPQPANLTNWGASHFVSDARLIQTPALSEMRISVRTDQLGSVEVRAHSVGDEIGAAIMVEKRDAHTALAIELPALQQSLTDKHINVARVVLTQGSPNFTKGDSHASPQGERHPAGSTFVNAYLNKDATVAEVTSPTLSGLSKVIFNSHGRLSVHA